MEAAESIVTGAFGVHCWNLMVWPAAWLAAAIGALLDFFSFLEVKSWQEGQCHVRRQSTVIKNNKVSITKSYDGEMQQMFVMDRC